MPGQTTLYALPYPLGGDSITDGNDRIQALAERVEALLAVRPNRNVIRNGDMAVNQRGVAAFTANGYCSDGWRRDHSGGTVSVVPTKVNAQDVASGGDTVDYTYSLGTTVAGQSAAGDYAMVSAMIEGVRTLQGRQVTLSFTGARSGAGSAGAKVGIEVQQNFGVGGDPVQRFSVGSVALNGADTRHTFTFTMPSIIYSLIGTSNDSLQINFWFSAGTTYAARSSNVGIKNASFYITNVQLEVGPVATPFERLPQQQQLAWCQRYFTRITSQSTGYGRLGLGQVNSATTAIIVCPLPVDMRAVPTMSLPYANQSWIYTAANFNATAASIDQGSVRMPSVVVTCSGGGMTPGQAAQWTAGGGVCAIDWTAEL